MKKIKIKNPYREELKKVPPVPPLSELLHQRFQATVNTKILPFRSQRVCILFRYFVVEQKPLEGLEARGLFPGLTIGQPFGKPFTNRDFALRSSSLAKVVV